MTLRRQMRDHVRLEIRHQASDQPLIADVASDEAITWIIFNGRKGRQNAGIGQLVEIEHLIFCLADQVPDQRGSDENCSSGDEDTHPSAPLHETNQRTAIISRSEERSEGKEGVSTCRYRGSRYN